MTTVLQLVALLFIHTAMASADDMSGVEWLEKMNQAMKERNFQGTVAFMKNGHLDTMKYIHAAKNGLEQERLLSLNSPMREVIRDAGKISCTFKETNKRVINHRPVSQSFIIDLPRQISSLTDVYQIVVNGEEEVAMRPAAVIEIRPLDAYRYSRKIWMDKQLMLPLKVEAYNVDGGVLEQVLFTDISVDQDIAFVKAKDNPALNVQHIHQIQSEPFENASFSLDNIPAGFQKVFFTRMSMHKASQPVDHMLLSDGFSSVSIYLENTVDEIEGGLHTLGSVNSFTRSIDTYQVTVLGEVPAKTVRFIAQGFRFNTP